MPRPWSASRDSAKRPIRPAFWPSIPNGSGHNPNLLTWNGGNCCGYAMRQNVNDVGLCVRAGGSGPASPGSMRRRIFATGISNGGVMAYRLASELSDRIASIASVAGPMGTETCRPTRPVSVLHFHGTADDFAPYNGGRGSKSFSQADFRSVDFTIRQWIEANGCPAAGLGDPPSAGDRRPDERHANDVGTRKGGERSRALHDRRRRPHVAGPLPFSRFSDCQPRQISANDVMWEFFYRHPMNDG